MAHNPGLNFDTKYFNHETISPCCIARQSECIEKAVDSENFFDSPKRNKLLWLLNAIEFIDLTTLSGDDTAANVNRLTYSAVNPLPNNVWRKLLAQKSTHEFPSSEFCINNIQCAAVCVYPSCVAHVTNCLRNLDEGSKKPKIAAVATGFPSGLYGLQSRLDEIKHAIDNGADEIDIVLHRELVLTGQWDVLYEEVKKCKEVCSERGAQMKTILSTGELGSLSNVYKASMVSMMAGSDFIKTTTGKEKVQATLNVGIVMCRAIKDYYRLTDNQVKVGLKPAGGLRTFKDAMQWMYLVENYLGSDWLDNTLFRIGASTLLDDVVNQLCHFLIGRNIKDEDYLFDE